MSPLMSPNVSPLSTTPRRTLSSEKPAASKACGLIKPYQTIFFVEHSGFEPNYLPLTPFENERIEDTNPVRTGAIIYRDIWGQAYAGNSGTREVHRTNVAYLSQISITSPPSSITSPFPLKVPLQDSLTFIFASSPLAKK